MSINNISASFKISSMIRNASTNVNLINSNSDYNKYNNNNNNNNNEQSDTKLIIKTKMENNYSDNKMIDVTDEQIEYIAQLLSNCKSYSKTTANDSRIYCPVRFDGYACWPKTLAGTMATQYCPDLVKGFDSKLLVHKRCLENGSWSAHPETGKEWTNYTTCVDMKDLEFREVVNNIYINGYIISLITLIISLCIFLSFRSLRCTRIRIHIQLFTSLALSCITWILWYKLIVDRPNNIKENPIWCVFLHLILHYLMLATYFWMFCEGLHLHLVLVVVFVKDSVAMLWFLMLGWIAPIILITIYAFVRGYGTGEAKDCWSEGSHALWILTIPVGISLVASMVFLINVVIVLFKKLHPCSAQPAPLALRKAARATLILVPLFGLHYILLPFRPEPGVPLERVYQIASALMVSLQGLCVSCLFCFANHDVLYAINGCFVRFFPSIVKPQHENNNVQQVSQTRDVVV